MLPTLAIVGRPNVGKSTLFNRLIGERKALVHDRPGVTRDRNHGVATYLDREFLCIDTGGLDPQPGDDLFDAIRSQVAAAVSEADLILFVVDARSGLTQADELCADLLRRQSSEGGRNREVLLLVNKCDGAYGEELGAQEFWKLGIDPMILMSAEHDRGTSELWDAVMERVSTTPVEEAEDEQEIRIAVIGRPNIGKSTLVNRLIGQERHVVHDAAGTTMDAIDSVVEVGDRRYRLVDTAGVRRKTRIDDRLETFAVARAIRTIERCHVTLLMIDGTLGPTDQDARLAALVVDRGRALITVINKWDLVRPDPERNAKDVTHELERRLPHADWSPTLYISAKTGKGTGRIFDLVETIYQEFDRRISTGELNRFFEDAVTRHPPPQKHNRPVRLNFITQARVRPPTFIIWSNSPEGVKAPYRRYLENRLRETYGFQGTPIRMVVKKKRKPRQAKEDV